MGCCGKICDYIKCISVTCIICGTVIAALLIYQLTKSSNQNFLPLSEEQAREHLETNGYTQSNLKKNSNFMYHGNEALNAILVYQRRYGLDETGELDYKTREFMARPHCGMPDFRNYSIYALGSSNKWNKERITYKIRTLTDDLPAQTVRQAFKHAFSAWSEYIPLEFTEAYGVADIEIKFLRGDHQCFIKFDGRGGKLAHVNDIPGEKIHFDEDENWVYMDGSAANDYYTDLLNVAIHEIGHILGLEHSETRGDLMFGAYLPTTDGQNNYREPKLSDNDIRRIQALYGARRSRPDGRPGKDDESDEDEIPTYAPQWPTFPHPRPTPMPHPFYPPPFAPPPPPWMPICCRHPWIFRWNAHGGPGFWSLKSSRNNIERPTHVDAFVNGPGEESYIFVGHHIYELHQNRINKTLRIKDVFPQLENTVSAGYYNEKTHTFVLFDQKNKVYAYHHRRNRDSAILNAGYPKEWPLAIYDESGHEAGLLDPIGAIWITPEAQIFTAQHVNLSGHVVVVSKENHLSLYDEHENRLILLRHSKIDEHFPDFPEHVKGGFIAFEEGVALLTLFTRNSVHLYEVNKKEEFGKSMTLHEYLE